ncbi:MAG: hypothetical protein K0Q73_7201 [Paenibacillus sp.]|jgi:hypothetical protein|nr:hypothetical protein [Paenibacillus sp.]
MTNRESLAKHLEEQAYFCQVLADKLRNGEDISDSTWLSDLFSTEEWNAEIAAIEAQEQLHYEHNQAMEERVPA